MIKAKSLSKVLNRIGLALSELRIRKGYDNIKEFARAYNLPLIQYWRIEKGKANVTINSLIKLLAIHQLGLEDFFCWLKDFS
jgi:transcriptional regulator with XRE-family HTH domain